MKAQDGPSRRRVLRLLPAVPVAAVSLPAKAVPPAPLRMTTMQVEPFGVIEKSGRLSGIYVDLSTMLARESGVVIDDSVVPYPRAMAMMASGDADLIMSITNSKLAAVARPLALLYTSDVVLMGRGGASFASLADAHGRTVAYIRGAEHSLEFNADGAIAKHEIINFRQGVKMLLEGRVDGVIGLRQSLLYVLRELGLPRKALGRALVLGQREAWLYMSRKAPSQEAAPLLARTANAMRERGAVKAVMDGYFGSLWPE